MNVKGLHLRKLLTLAAIAVFAGVPLEAPVPASATTLTTNLLASATISAGCSAISASPLAFGTVAPLARPSATAIITTTCTALTTSTITFGNGSNYSTTRNLKSTGSTLLAYGLFSDAGRTTVIPAGGIPLPASFTEPVNTPIYGQLAAAVPASTVAGVYTDTVVVTLTF
jgi:spore coat protein U-like protein